MREGDWKVIYFYDRKKWELYDLSTDIGEENDLAAARPEVAREMDAKLREIVDYEAVDARAKEYDRRSFRQWRAEEQAAGTYEQTMARIHSGWDDLGEDQITPWAEQDEKLIEQWLGRA